MNTNKEKAATPGRGEAASSKMLNCSHGPIDTMLLRLEGVRRTGNGTCVARCPAHADKSPSLSLRDSDSGAVLIHCFAGCAAHEVARTTLNPNRRCWARLLRDNAATDRVELAEADFYSADHRSVPGLPSESCEGDVSPFRHVSMIDRQANLMQKAFAAGRMDDARAHCKIFTELLRERAKSFLNDSTGCAARPADSRPAGQPSPHHDRNARGDARQEK